MNSINWARLLAQVVYYFAGYFQATHHNDQNVSFSVPSGNFGNICAGHVARMMGLPIRKLVLATNENDVLDEFFRTGVYRVRGGLETYETSSPSMDISKASNFERFIFDLIGRDSARVKSFFGDQLGISGSFDLSQDSLFRQAGTIYGFVSGKSTHADRLKNIKECHDRFGKIVDTHTADGLQIAKNHLEVGVPMIVLETALPIKFSETIFQALGFKPNCPIQFKGIEFLPKRVIEMPADLGVIQNYIVKICS